MNELDGCLPESIVYIRTEKRDMETVSFIIAFHNIITTIIGVVSLALADGVGDNETIIMLDCGSPFSFAVVGGGWWSDKLGRCVSEFVGFPIKNGRRTRSGRREFDAYLRLITNEYTCQWLCSGRFEGKGSRATVGQLK